MDFAFVLQTTMSFPQLCGKEPGRSKHILPESGTSIVPRVNHGGEQSECLRSARTRDPCVPWNRYVYDIHDTACANLVTIKNESKKSFHNAHALPRLFLESLQLS